MYVNYFDGSFVMGKGGRDLHKYLFTIIMNSIAVCTDLLVVVVLNKQLNQIKNESRLFKSLNYVVNEASRDKVGAWGFSSSLQ